jgi:hypothetical protein
MAEIYKILGQVSPLATAETALYSVPVATAAVVSTFTICNRGASAATFRVSVSPAGAATAAKDYLYYDLLLAANDTFAATFGVTLATGDAVRVYASKATLSFNVFGTERT